MDLRQLKYFAAIVELGSFSRAAREIYIAQPALSSQIAALEAELDTQLLIRTARGVTPTDAGLTLYRTAGSILRQLDGLRRDVAQCSNNPSGSVSIGISTSTATVLALPLLKKVRSRYPDIRLQITESLSTLLKELLLHGRLDMAVLLNEGSSKNLFSMPLMSEELFLASPKRGIRKRIAGPVRLAELANKQFVLPSRLVPLRQFIESTLANHGLRLDVVAEIDSIPTLKGAVESGLGCTILPWCALHKEALDGAINVQKILAPSMSWEISLCTISIGALSTAAQTVLQVVPEVVSELRSSHHWQGTELVDKGLHLPQSIAPAAVNTAKSARARNP